MRQGTLLFWLAVILLFAFFGASFLKFVVGAVIAFVVVLLLVLLVAAWTFKRRMDHKLRELRLMVAQANARANAAQRRGDAIDADFEPKP